MPSTAGGIVWLHAWTAKVGEVTGPEVQIPFAVAPQAGSGAEAARDGRVGCEA